MERKSSSLTAAQLGRRLWLPRLASGQAGSGKLAGLLTVRIENASKLLLCPFCQRWGHILANHSIDLRGQPMFLGGTDGVRGFVISSTVTPCFGIDQLSLGPVF